MKSKAKARRPGMHYREKAKPTLAAFAAARAKSKTPQCRVCRLEKSLRAKVEAGMKSGYQNAVIYDWLRKIGSPVGEESIRAHRREHV